MQDKNDNNDYFIDGDFFTCCLQKDLSSEKITKFEELFGKIVCFIPSTWVYIKKNQKKTFYLEPRHYIDYVNAIKKSLIENEDLLFNLVKQNNFTLDNSKTY